MGYKKQLKSKEWYLRRSLILKRDNYKCTECGTHKNLQVHHKAYVRGREVWNYTDEYLITLCETCHKKEHDSKPITSFYKEGLPNYTFPGENRIQKIHSSTSPTFEFGKYRGMTIEEVHDLKYIDWYIKTKEKNRKMLQI